MEELDAAAGGDGVSFSDTVNELFYGEKDADQNNCSNYYKRPAYGGTASPTAPPRWGTAATAGATTPAAPRRSCTTT